MRTRWIPFGIVVLLAVAAIVWVTSDGPSSPHRAAAPKPNDGTHWSTPVAAVARDVEKLRGLDFVHPVPVRFLDRDALARRYRQMNHQASRRESYDVAGFYDELDRAVFVLGDAQNPGSRALLAHELTHVLQDQHFDTFALGRKLTEARSWGVETDLLEGDAMLVFDRYAAELEADGSLPRWRAALVGPNVPAGPTTTDYVVRLAPYLVAPSALRVYRASSGGSTDNAFRHPPATDAAFLTPSKFTDTGQPRGFPPPRTDAGEQVDGGPYQFNALHTYLLLAERLDPEAALRIADGWAFGVARNFARDDQVCTRAGFGGNSAAADTALADGLARWAAKGDGSDSVVTDVSSQYGAVTTLTWCRDRDEPAPRVEHARHVLMVPATRNHLEAELADHVPLAAAECAADAAMDEPAFGRMVRDAERYPWREPARVRRADTVNHLDELAEACLPVVKAPLSQT